MEVLHIRDDDGGYELNPFFRTNGLSTTGNISVFVFGKFQNSIGGGRRWIKRYQRHLQRCANLHLRWPKAHPFGWPPLPVGAPLPKPWKKDRR